MPTSLVPVDGGQADELMRLIESLEENDDVRRSTPTSTSPPTCSSASPASDQHPPGARGRHPSSGGVSAAMVVLGIDPGLAQHGYGIVATSRRAPRRARWRRGRDPARAAHRAAADVIARGRELIDEHGRDAVAIEELYFGPTPASRSPSVRRAACVLAAGGAASRASRTRRSRSRRRCAATAAPTKDQVRGWSRPARPRRSRRPRPRLRRARGRDLPRELPRRFDVLRGGAGAMIARCAARSSRAAPIRRDRVRRRRLPRGRLGGDAAPVPAVGEETIVETYLLVREDALPLYGFLARRSAISS